MATHGLTPTLSPTRTPTWTPTPDPDPTLGSDPDPRHDPDPAGLVDGMLGMVAGDSREVEITMPDTWDPPQLRGVRVKCRVSVKELFQWELPEVRAAIVERCAGRGEHTPLDSPKR